MPTEDEAELSKIKTSKGMRPTLNRSPNRTQQVVYSRQNRSSLGAGLVFVDIMTLYEAFAGTGITETAFRRWLKALKVPCMHIGETCLVRVQTFKEALLFINRQGQPDFLVPGCKALRLRKAKIIDKSVRALDIDEFEKAHEQVIAELLFAHAAAGNDIGADVARLASETARRMLIAALQTAPLMAQENADRKNLAALRKEVPITPHEAIEAMKLEDNSLPPSASPYVESTEAN